MVIIRDPKTGEIIGQEASARYVPTRKLRHAHEQGLCDKQLDIKREQTTKPDKLVKANQKRVEAGMDPIFNNVGYRPCGCADYPCCGH